MSKKRKNLDKQKKEHQKLKGRNRQRKAKYSALGGTITQGSKQDQKRKGSYHPKIEQSGEQHEDPDAGYTVENRGREIVVHLPRHTGVSTVTYDSVMDSYEAHGLYGRRNSRYDLSYTLSREIFPDVDSGVVATVRRLINNQRFANR